MRRRRAERLADQKSRLGRQHIELWRQLESSLQQAAADADGKEVVGPPATDIPIAMEVFTTGKFPAVVTLPALEAEIKVLEQWLRNLPSA